MTVLLARLAALPSSMPRKATDCITWDEACSSAERMLGVLPAAEFMMSILPSDILCLCFAEKISE